MVSRTIPESYIDMGSLEMTIAALPGHGKCGVTQGYIHIEESLRVAARVSACIAEWFDGKRATIRDAGVTLAV